MPDIRPFRANRIAGQAGKLRVIPREPLHYLASRRCHGCLGSGFRKGKTCHCVLRHVSRVAIYRLHHVQASGPRLNHHVFTRDAEYAADMVNIAKNALDPLELRIWRKYIVNRQLWTAFTDKAGRGNFFHAVYRAEEKFGRALLASGCFPPSAYFAGVHQAGPEHRPNTNFFSMHDWHPGANGLESRLELSGGDTEAIAA